MDEIFCSPIIGAGVLEPHLDKLVVPYSRYNFVVVDVLQSDIF
jgi:hypothetical protein